MGGTDAFEVFRFEHIDHLTRHLDQYSKYQVYTCKTPKEEVDVVDEWIKQCGTNCILYIDDHMACGGSYLKNDILKRHKDMTIHLIKL